MSKNIKRDIVVLKRIRTYQAEMKREIKENKISRAEDLEKVSFVVRRGLVGMVADIFELMNALKEETIKNIGISYLIIKDFRNTSAHNYGSISNTFAYICIQHCISKEIIDKVKTEIIRLSSLQE